MQKIKNDLRQTIIFIQKLSIVFIFILLCSKNAHANLVFPAIVNQFMISGVVPSYYSVILGVLVLIVESYFLNKFWRKNWIICFVIALVINLISSIGGVVILMKYWSIFIPKEITGGIFEYQNIRWGTYIGMIPGYILTVLIEGIVLWLLAKFFKNKNDWKDLLKLSAKMNAYSYLILLLGIILADILTNGQNFKTF